VIACAVIGALFFLLQAAVLAFIIVFKRGFDATYPVNSLQVLIGMVVLAGALLVGWFLRAKRVARRF
jgi:hypothetical protein